MRREYQCPIGVLVYTLGPTDRQTNHRIRTAIETQTSTLTADPSTVTTTITVTSMRTVTSAVTQPIPITSVLKRGTNGTQTATVSPTGVPAYLTTGCAALSDYVSACGCFGVRGTVSTRTATVTLTTTGAPTATISTTAIANVTTTPPAVTVTATSTAVVTTTTALSSFQLRTVTQAGGSGDQGTAVYVAELSTISGSETIFQAVADASRALTCVIRTGGQLKCGTYTAAQQIRDSAFRGMSDSRWATVGPNVRPVTCQIDEDGILSCAGWEESPRRVEFSYPFISSGRRPDIFLSPAGQSGTGRNVVTFQAVPVPVALQPI